MDQFTREAIAVNDMLREVVTEASNCISSTRMLMNQFEAAVTLLDQTGDTRGLDDVRKLVIERLPVKDSTTSKNAPNEEDMVRRSQRNIKKEKEDMPPPTILPRRALRPKIKTEPVSDDIMKPRSAKRGRKAQKTSESDTDSRNSISIIEQKVEMIDLEDSNNSASSNSKKDSEHSVYEDAVAAPQETFATPCAPVTNINVNHLDINLKQVIIKVERLSAEFVNEIIRKSTEHTNENQNHQVETNPPNQSLPNANETVAIHKSNTTFLKAVSNKPQLNEITVHEKPTLDAAVNGSPTITRTWDLPKEAKKVQANETMVLDKPIFHSTALAGNGHPNLALEDLMTDDESIECSPDVKSKTKNQLFSPYVNSPLKKKVEAFEKLTGGTMRITRTKSRLLNKTEGNGANLQKSATSVKKKVDNCITPIKLSYKENASGAIRKAQTENVIKAKEEQIRRNALLAKQLADKERLQELREARIQQQREEAERLKKKQAERALKLKEAQMRREALIAKQAAEKRRQQEEIQMRQQREDAERQEKALLKFKEERRLQRLAAQQAELAKQVRLQQEQQRLMNAKAQKQEDMRMFELRVQEAKQAAAEAAKNLKPPYLIHKAPFLPTPDCYDSDDEMRPKHRILPLWNQSGVLHNLLKNNQYVNGPVVNSLFCPKAETPNLIELFPNLDPKALRRNSSANWKAVPRFTMVAHLNQNERF